MNGDYAMDKNLTVKEFVEGYKKTTNTDKSKYLKTKLTTLDYLPTMDKIIAAQNLIKSTSYAVISTGNTTENNDELIRTNRIHINSPMRYILYVMTVVDRYTNIEVDFNAVMGEYDLLNSNSLVEVIFDKIGKKETTEMSTIIDMTLNDFMENEYETHNFITRQLNGLSGSLEKVVDVVDNIIQRIDTMDEKELEGIAKKVDKFLSRLK